MILFFCDDICQALMEQMLWFVPGWYETKEAVWNILFNKVKYLI